MFGSIFRFMVASAVSASTAASATLLRCAIACVTTVAAEFRNGERHTSEERARTLVITAGSAFLIGYTIVGALNKQLGRALKSDDREYAKGDVKTGTVGENLRLSAKTALYLFGKLAAFAGVARALAVADTGSEDYRLYGFYDCQGVAVSDNVEISDVAERVLGAGGEG